jgi:phosphoribosylpyrophosphate synthetase
MRSDPEGSGFSLRVSDAIRTLKNTFNRENDNELFRAKNYIRTIATTDLKQIIEQERIENPIIICVPRSKADFSDKQLLFRIAISEAANSTMVTNGVEYIKRIRNTKTTHLANTRKGDMSGDGDMPYPGITNDTCRLNGSVNGRNVILVDDIYTKTINIDEDCCQFLLDNGAKSVTLYTICKTTIGS